MVELAVEAEVVDGLFVQPNMLGSYLTKRKRPMSCNGAESREPRRTGGTVDAHAIEVKISNVA